MGSMADQKQRLGDFSLFEILHRFLTGVHDILPSTHASLIGARQGIVVNIISEKMPYLSAMVVEIRIAFESIKFTEVKDFIFAPG